MNKFSTICYTSHHAQVQVLACIHSKSIRDKSQRSLTAEVNKSKQQPHCQLHKNPLLLYEARLMNVHSCLILPDGLGARRVHND